jgi:hypothetical protein
MAVGNSIKAHFLAAIFIVQ